MKKYAVLITLLSTMLTTSLYAEEVMHQDIPFSFYRGDDTQACYFYTAKPDKVPPILITGRYQRSINTLTFIQKFGIKGLEELGNSNFGYPHYLTSQNSSTYYKFLRKEYLYIVHAGTLLFEHYHHDNSEKCKTSFEIDIKKS